MTASVMARRAALPRLRLPRPRLPRLRLPPILLAAPALALAAGLLPWQQSWLAALAAIILLGVPHGALDGEIARAILRPRFGRAWFTVFALPYLSLSAVVLLAWHLAPLCTLGGFLAASVWHFGSEDAPPGETLEALVRGGLPIALPLLAYPAATTLVFSTIARTPLAGPPAWLWLGSLCWLALAITWLARTLLRGQARRLLGPVLLACVFLAVPPLPAFAIYFVCVHAPAHMAALIRHPRRAPRVTNARGALGRALPITALTLAIGAALWPLYTGMPAVRLLALTLQLLAALTLPHMLLDAWLSRRDRAKLLL